MLRLLAALVIAGSAALLALLAWPQLLDLQRTIGFAQIVSLRGAATTAALLLALALALLAALVRPLRRLLGAVAVLVLLFAAVSGGIVASRGVGGQGFQTATGSDVRVLAWNTLGEAVTASEVADLAVESDADIVALPETSAAFADEVAALAGQQGLILRASTTAFDEVAKARSTSLLVSDRLGEYDLSEDAVTSVLPSALATPADADGPTIAAVHPVAPIPGELGSWRADLRSLAALCADPNVILAGDFNATLDAFAGLEDPGVPGADLGGCTDAARVAGTAGVGTWPASIPALLGAPIDHVMVGSAWQVTGFRVLLDRDGAGSDHRPVLAQLRPAD